MEKLEMQNINDTLNVTNETSISDSKRRKNKKSKIKKKMSKKRFWITMSSVVIMGFIFGLGIGKYIIGGKLDPNRYNFAVSALVDNVDDIKKEAKNKNQIKLGATKCCVLAFDKTFNYEDVKIVGKGEVIAQVGPVKAKQTIDSLTIRNGKNLFIETISISQYVQALNRNYVNDGTIKQYGGKINGNTITWDGQNYNTGENDIKTMKDYQTRYGATLFEYMTYIVSSKTVVTESEVQQDENGNYTFSLTLDKSKSVVNYVKAMKDTGGLKDYPDFTSDPKITLLIDADYRILKFESEEQYTANVGIRAKSNATLTNIFTYDGNFAIPALTDNSTKN